MTETQPLSPNDFGPDRHGVHISMNENGNYLAFGHHPARRIMAAINADARDFGYKGDEASPADIAAGLVYPWINQIERNADGEWRGQWCTEDDPGAVPVTAVIL